MSQCQDPQLKFNTQFEATVCWFFCARREELHRVLILRMSVCWWDNKSGALFGGQMRDNLLQRRLGRETVLKKGKHKLRPKRQGWVSQTKKLQGSEDTGEKMPKRDKISSGWKLRSCNFISTPWPPSKFWILQVKLKRKAKLLLLQVT